MLQLLLGVFSGSITPVQTAVNARLGRSVGSPLRASMVSFSVGLLSMLAIVLATGPYPLLSATAADGPWWMWLAGVFGVTFLTGNVLLLPKLGSLRTVIMRHGSCNGGFPACRHGGRSAAGSSRCGG